MIKGTHTKQNGIKYVHERQISKEIWQKNYELIILYINRGFQKMHRLFQTWEWKKCRSLARSNINLFVTTCWSLRSRSWGAETWFHLTSREYIYYENERKLFEFRHLPSLLGVGTEKKTLNILSLKLRKKLVGFLLDWCFLQSL